MGGWIRIGIVLSVVWAVAGFLWGHSLMADDVQLRIGRQLDACVHQNKTLLHSRGDDSEPYDKIWTPCWAEHNTNYLADIQGFWWGVAVVALAPIPIAWLLIYGLVCVGRWIRHGFRAAT
jgi:hypothetical protein